MKKFLVLLIIGAMMFAIVSGLASCGPEEEPAPDQPYEYDDFVADAQANTPAKVTTLVHYTIGDDRLNGKYITYTGGEIVTFHYEYDRYATVEEGADTRIVRTVGTIYYKDGLVAAADGDDEPSEWVAVAPSGINVGVALDKCKDIAVLNSAKSVATVVLSGDKIVDVLGTDLAAVGDVNLTISVNNGYLNNVKIDYTTERGASVIVETSYTYSTATSADVDLEVAIANVAALCRVSNPAKIETTTKQRTSSLTQTGKATMTRGTIGGKQAAIYVRTVEKLANVENAKPIQTEKVTLEYLEDVGLRINGGEWNPNGQSFAPSEGFLKLNLPASDRLMDKSYQNGVLTFTIAQRDVASALAEILDGETVDADVTVSITNAAGVIVKISLAYTLEVDDYEAINQSDIDVQIDAVYSYDLEEITIH